MVATFPMTSRKEIQSQLIEKAHRQGAITYDDILALLPEAETDVALLDDVMDSLLEAGIEVLPGAPVETDAAPVGARPGGDEIDIAAEGEDITLLDNDLVDDAGYQQALDTDDVVGLYLKEAGRVP